MFTKEWLSMLLQFLILVPGALSCYLPVKTRIRFSERKTLILCSGAAVLFAFLGASAAELWNVDPNFIGFPILVISFFLYKQTVELDLSRTLAIYIGVCAIETVPVQLGTIVDMYFNNESDKMSLQGCAVLLGCSCVMLTVFIHPAREKFSKAVEELDMPMIWNSTTVISAIFLIYNVLATPASYDVVRGSRLKFLFPMFEGCALALLITVYVLFYSLAITIIDRNKFEKRSQLLEMQSQRIGELQECIQQTARLRHDFKHSVHLISMLAEQGDLESIRAHISEYDKRLSENVSVNFCSNFVLNALFGYY